MSLDIFAIILGALTSLAMGGIASSDVIRMLIRRLRHLEEPEKSYSERLSELTASLTKASREVDSILIELSRVAKSRESAVVTLEADLASLEAREIELKERIDVLQKVPIPAAEQFAKLLKTGEKKTARRDYVLFGAGVLTTTFAAVAIQLFARR